MWRSVLIILVIGCIVGFDVAAAGENSGSRIPISVTDTTRPISVIVEPGDHLWKISEQHLEGTRRAVANYWLNVIEVNTPTLRSGDPDLIYPGEVISLP